MNKAFALLLLLISIPSVASVNIYDIPEELMEYTIIENDSRVAYAENGKIHISNTITDVIQTHDEYLLVLYHELGHIKLDHINKLKALKRSGMYVPGIRASYELESDNYSIVRLKKLGISFKVCEFFNRLPDNTKDTRYPLNSDRYTNCTEQL